MHAIIIKNHVNKINKFDISSILISWVIKNSIKTVLTIEVSIKGYKYLTVEAVSLWYSTTMIMNRTFTSFIISRRKSQGCCRNYNHVFLWEILIDIINEINFL